MFHCSHFQSHGDARYCILSDREQQGDHKGGAYLHVRKKKIMYGTKIKHIHKNYDTALSPKTPKIGNHINIRTIFKFIGCCQCIGCTVSAFDSFDRA